MDKAAIENIIRAQALTPRYQRVNERSIRVFAAAGQTSRTLGYLSTIEQMTEETLVGHIKAAFARKAR